MRSMPVVCLGLAVLTAACSSNPSAAPVAPQAAPAAMPAATPPAAAAPAPSAPASADVDLSGAWGAQVDAGGQMIPVDVTLTRGTTGYTGTAAPQGQESAPLTSLTVTGDRVRMTFASPQGEAVFAGTLSADRRMVTGNVEFGGQALPFTMTKKP